MRTASTPEPVDKAVRSSKGQGGRRRQDKAVEATTGAKDAAVAGVFNVWMFLQDAISSWGKTLRFALLLTLLLAILVAGIILITTAGGDVGAIIRGLASGVVATVGFLVFRWRRQQQQLSASSQSRPADTHVLRLAPLG